MRPQCCSRNSARTATSWLLRGLSTGNALEQRACPALRLHAMWVGWHPGAFWVRTRSVTYAPQAWGCSLPRRPLWRVIQRDLSCRAVSREAPAAPRGVEGAMSALGSVPSLGQRGGSSCLRLPDT